LEDSGDVAEHVSNIMSAMVSQLRRPGSEVSLESIEKMLILRMKETLDSNFLST